ncbi:MAG: hypothetical protein AAF411_00240 [Myxococcota bacterium]
MCCAEGACTEGACVGGRCAAFGGVFARVRDADEEPAGFCKHPNPLRVGGGCECPPGFVEQEIGDMDNDGDEGIGFGESLFVCRAEEEIEEAEFRGAFNQVTGGLRTTSDCEITEICDPNGYTGDCSCSDGTASIDFPGSRLNRGDNDCAVETTFCRGTGAPLSFGGAFRVVDRRALRRVLRHSDLRAEPLHGRLPMPRRLLRMAGGGVQPRTLRALRAHLLRRHSQRLYARAGLRPRFPPRVANPRLWTAVLRDTSSAA